MLPSDWVHLNEIRNQMLDPSVQRCSSDVLELVAVLAQKSGRIMETCRRKPRCMIPAERFLYIAYGGWGQKKAAHLQLGSSALHKSQVGEVLFSLRCAYRRLCAGAVTCALLGCPK